MARVDAGALHMESRPVSVASMVARACAPLELSLDLRGIALVIEIPGNAHFTGDETWCAEAIENIVRWPATSPSATTDPAYPMRTFPISSSASTGAPHRGRAPALAWDSHLPARSSRGKVARYAPRTFRARMAAPPVPSSKSPFPKSASDVRRVSSLQSRNARVTTTLARRAILVCVSRTRVRKEHPWTSSRSAT